MITPPMPAVTGLSVKTPRFSKKTPLNRTTPIVKMLFNFLMVLLRDEFSMVLYGLRNEICAGRALPADICVD
jgi:hypothetical protein